jgi:hypothetical protein
LQFFENDEKLFGFLVDSNNASKSPNDKNHVSLSKYCIEFESLFTRDDQTKLHDRKEDTFFRKVHETQKINIGTHGSPKYVNIGSS